jgi:hypothetical protein
VNRFADIDPLLSLHKDNQLGLVLTRHTRRRRGLAVKFHAGNIGCLYHIHTDVVANPAHQLRRISVTPRFSLAPIFLATLIALPSQTNVGDTSRNGTLRTVSPMLV